MKKKKCIKRTKFNTGGFGGSTGFAPISTGSYGDYILDPFGIDPTQGKHKMLQLDREKPISPIPTAGSLNAPKVKAPVLTKQEPIKSGINPGDKMKAPGQGLGKASAGLGMVSGMAGGIIEDTMVDTDKMKTGAKGVYTGFKMAGDALAMSPEPISNMVGQALKILTPLGAGIAQKVKAKRANLDPEYEQGDSNLFTTGHFGFANGGKIPFDNSKLLQFKGPKHKDGGIPIDFDKDGIEESEVEGGETMKNGYIFSDQLGYDKKNNLTDIKKKVKTTFADKSKSIENKFKGRFDETSKFTKELEMKKLQNENEVVKNKIAVKKQKAFERKQFAGGGNTKKESVIPQGLGVRPAEEINKSLVPGGFLMPSSSTSPAPVVKTTTPITTTQPKTIKKESAFKQSLRKNGWGFLMGPAPEDNTPVQQSITKPVAKPASSKPTLTPTVKPASSTTIAPVKVNTTSTAPKNKTVSTTPPTTQPVQKPTPTNTSSQSTPFLGTPALSPSSQSPVKPPLYNYNMSFNQFQNQNLSSNQTPSTTSPTKSTPKPSVNSKTPSSTKKVVQSKPALQYDPEVAKWQQEMLNLGYKDSDMGFVGIPDGKMGEHSSALLARTTKDEYTEKDKINPVQLPKTEVENRKLPEFSFTEKPEDLFQLTKKQLREDRKNSKDPKENSFGDLTQGDKIQLGAAFANYASKLAQSMKKLDKEPVWTNQNEAAALAKVENLKTDTRQAKNELQRNVEAGKQTMASNSRSVGAQLANNQALSNKEMSARNELSIKEMEFENNKKLQLANMLTQFGENNKQERKQAYINRQQNKAARDMMRADANNKLESTMVALGQGKNQAKLNTQQFNMIKEMSQEFGYGTDYKSFLKDINGAGLLEYLGQPLDVKAAGQGNAATTAAKVKTEKERREAEKNKTKTENG